MSTSPRTGPVRRYLFWLFGIMALYFLLSTAINAYYDPFFQLRAAERSNSSEAISRPFNEILMKVGLARDSSHRKFIFGDSRAANLPRKMIAEVGGDQWFNFGVGGAAPREIVALVNRTIDERAVDHVLIVLPLRLFVERRLNRVPEVLSLAENRGLYLTNNLVLRASLANLVHDVSGQVTKTQKQGGTKRDAWNHWLQHARRKTQDWAVPQQLMADLDATFRELRARNIDFTVMIPPIHSEVRRIYASGMPEVWRAYHDFLYAQPETIDCSRHPVTNDEALFRDPYHADGPLMRRLFSDFVGQRSDICMDPAATAAPSVSSLHGAPFSTSQ